MSKKINGVTVGTPLNPDRFGKKVEVDDTLSATSTNPVQNKVVVEALDKKIEKVNIAKNTDIDKLFS